MNKRLINVVIAAVALSSSSCLQAANDDWRETGILQAYLQSYDGATSRQLAFNAGVYLEADYLDSGGVSAGYNFTFSTFDNNAELTEHMFYLSGRYHHFTDVLPGKLTYRLDGYIGEDTLRYNVNNPPGSIGGGGMGGRMMGGGTSTISESTDIFAYQPIIAFINHAKTYYVNIGYAYSKYDGISETEVDQLTPTVGFGWNDSFDWLQLRGFFIEVESATSSRSSEKFESLEIKYTHWFSDTSSSAPELWRISVVAGERLFAIDPDAAVIYSTADKQTASLTASMQWKLSDTSRVLTLINYNQYESDIQEDYDSMLVYINLQRRW